MIEIWLDPAVGDRATEVCDAVNAVSGAARNADELTESAFRAFENLGLSPSLYQQPLDDLSTGVIAIGATIGSGD